LLVNFDSDDLETYGVYLRHVGFDAVTACEMSQAVQIAESLRPAAIVMDITEGHHPMIARVKVALEAAPAIIIVSSHVLPAERALALRAGGNVFLPKPCLPSTLAAALDEALQPLTGSGGGTLQD
jgi:DNA-binding response OmpR family regulator